MSSKQSTTDTILPSWDEFNVAVEEVEDQKNELYGPSLPTENDEEPEDPKTHVQQYSMNFNKFSTSENSRDDYFMLPSIHNNNEMFQQQQCSSSSSILHCYGSSLTTPQESTSNNNNNQKIIGPVLPIEFLPQLFNVKSDSMEKEIMIGPSIPFEIQQQQQMELPQDSEIPRNSSSSNISKIQEENEEKIIGPSWPPFPPPPAQNCLSSKLDEATEEDNDDDEEDDDNVIGPQLPKSEAEQQNEYLYRLKNLKEKNDDSISGCLKREEWMIELPKKLKTNYGLTAKTSFSKVSGNISSTNSTNLWTTIQNAKSKNKKNTNATSSNTSKFDVERDKKEEEKSRILMEERKESLLDQHQRKRKIKDDAQSNGDSSENMTRRCFNREIDMESRTFSSTTKQANSQLENLNSRFQSGSTRKYL